MIKEKIGFIGSGQIAGSLAVGFTRAGLVDGKQIYASDPFEGSRRAFAKMVPGSTLMDDNRRLAAEVDVLFLAVKPQFISDVLDGLAGAVTEKQLVVSLVGGMRMAQIAKVLGDKARLSRIVPNTACLVGCSASGYSLGPNSTDADEALLAELFSSIGIAHQLDEDLLDPITGLAGSGIAFVYMMIEAMSDGGVLVGLPRKLSTELAAQTVRGAAAMVLRTGEHTGRLKDRVASPGGTTIEGINAMENGAVRGALMKAVRRATLKSIELGKVCLTTDGS